MADSTPVAPQRPPIQIYTDGACSDNPGAGGWAAILQCAGLEKVLTGGARLTTNNRMELQAVINGLRAIRWDGATVTVYTDSKYVHDPIAKGWLKTWIGNGFKKKKNPDLWMELVPLLRKHKVSFEWVRGHNGHPLNERCDRLAVGVYQTAQTSGSELPPDTAFEEEYESAGADWQETLF